MNVRLGSKAVIRPDQPDVRFFAIFFSVLRLLAR